MEEKKELAEKTPETTLSSHAITILRAGRETANANGVKLPEDLKDLKDLTATELALAIELTNYRIWKKRSNANPNGYPAKLTIRPGQTSVYKHYSLIREHLTFHKASHGKLALGVGYIIASFVLTILLSVGVLTLSPYLAVLVCLTVLITGGSLVYLGNKQVSSLNVDAPKDVCEAFAKIQEFERLQRGNFSMEEFFLEMCSILRLQSSSDLSPKTEANLPLPSPSTWTPSSWKPSSLPLTTLPPSPRTPPDGGKSEDPSPPSTP